MCCAPVLLQLLPAYSPQAQLPAPAEHPHPCSLVHPPQAACCSEEFLLALGEAAPLQAQAGSLVARSGRLWTGDGRHLVSHEPRTGQVLLAAQHACTGNEGFTLQLSATGELRLVAEGAAAAGAASSSGGSSGGDDARGSRDSSGGGMEAQPLLPVAVRQGQPTTAGAAKPTRFALELASHKPTLLLTAHGHTLGCPPTLATVGGRPRGLLLPPGTAAPGGAAGPSPAALERCCAWRLAHHGDSVYSLQLCGRSLFIDDTGVPCLAAAGAGPVYPDERLLFWVEPGSVTLLPSPAGSTAGDGGGDGHDGASAGTPAAAEAAAAAGFLLPRAPGAVGDCSSDAGSASSGAGMTSSGFSIRSVRRVVGRHLYLSALPCGLLTTTFVTSSPSRWELFTVIDLQARRGSAGREGRQVRGGHGELACSMPRCACPLLPAPTPCSCWQQPCTPHPLHPYHCRRC